MAGGPTLGGITRVHLDCEDETFGFRPGRRLVPPARLPVQFLSGAFVPRGMDLPFTASAQAIDGSMVEPRRVRSDVDLVAVVDMGFGVTVSASTRDGPSGAGQFLAVVLMRGLRHRPPQGLSALSTPGDCCHDHTNC
jgi:hypothetical protein